MDTIPVKILVGFFVEIDRQSKIHMEIQKTHNSQNTAEEKLKLEGPTLLASKTHSAHTRAPVTSDKGAKECTGGKGRISNKWHGSNCTSTGKTLN